MSRFVAAIDQGTSSTRCIIVDGAGSVVASAQREHRQLFPRAGWIEHDLPVRTAGWRGWHNAVDRSLGWVPNDNEENGHD